MSKNKGFSDTAAGRYSLALYELAIENNLVEEIEKNSSSIIQLISSNDNFNSIIKNPTIKREDKLNRKSICLCKRYFSHNL